MKKELLSIAEENDSTVIVEKIKGLNKEIYKTSVAFLGEFSSGKTTLVNALLRKQFLPSFDKPTTAIITEITKGDETSFSIIEHNNGLVSNKEIAVSEVSNEVQQEGKNRLLKVKVKNSDLLDENTILIDTPGVSSINDTHSKVTYGYLPNMDVVFMVVNINMGSVSKSLQTFIQDCPENVKEKLHFVLNFKDTKSPSQIEKLVFEFKKSIEDFIYNPNILVVSSKNALKANALNDNDLYKKSGVGEVEEIIKTEIPKLHKEIAERRYLESLTKCKNDLIYFLQEKESNLKLDKSDFLKKIEDFKIEKNTLKKDRNKITNDFKLIKKTTEERLVRLNRDYVYLFINGLNNNDIGSIVGNYAEEFQKILKSQLEVIENYNLPKDIVGKLTNSTIGSINSKVGTVFEIANKLPRIINSAAIALATGGTSVAANLAETALVHAGGKVIELVEKNLEDGVVKEDVKKLVNETLSTSISKEEVIESKENEEKEEVVESKENEEKEEVVESKEKKIQVSNSLSKEITSEKPLSKKKMVVGLIFSALDQLNVVGILKDKITEETQKSNIYNALKNNSGNIIKGLFENINVILNEKMDIEINEPIRLKEVAIIEVKEELSKSEEELNQIKNQISKNLITLYKI